MCRGGGFARRLPARCYVGASVFVDHATSHAHHVLCTRVCTPTHTHTTMTSSINAMSYCELGHASICTQVHTLLSLRSVFCHPWHTMAASDMDESWWLLVSYYMILCCAILSYSAISCYIRYDARHLRVGGGSWESPDPSMKFAEKSDSRSRTEKVVLPAAVRRDMVLHQAFRTRRVRKPGIGGQVRHGVASGVSCETSLNTEYNTSPPPG